MSSDLTPNHMPRRLIQAWCVANAKSGIERIPTPESPVHKSVIYVQILPRCEKRKPFAALECSEEVG
ncbi:hypothetical protein F511_05711 [Dorcoceras hygrometricum]|uniref:U-box domain-containing protein n=1 Tax=Dorcoceras hygrometricum TaxID=472368 RepID=A0A2Z7B8U6_9LAMI|nr:hypothetical protein F511_05711 [Dorcoceras hygrometricum]